MRVGLAAHSTFVRALDGASSIVFGSYSLASHGSVARALERAGGRGAAVSVTLEGEPFPGADGDALSRANQSVARDLREHGVRVRLAGPADERFHLKAATVDGKAYLDDRNWPDDGGDTIVATSAPSGVAAVASALEGHPASNGALATEKAPALRLEADAIANASGERIDVETESFGGCAVTAALRARATAGTHVRLIISAVAYARSTPREHSEVAHLAAAGIAIRLGRSAEKLCIGGDRGWVGSANASYSPGPMFDWGLPTHDRAVLDGLARSFARDWQRARPLEPPR
jgi:hypothetical protein